MLDVSLKDIRTRRAGLALTRHCRIDLHPYRHPGPNSVGSSTRHAAVLVWRQPFPGSASLSRLVRRRAVRDARFRASEAAPRLHAHGPHSTGRYVTDDFELIETALAGRAEVSAAASRVDTAAGAHRRGGRRRTHLYSYGPEPHPNPNANQVALTGCRATGALTRTGPNSNPNQVRTVGVQGDGRTYRTWRRSRYPRLDDGAGKHLTDDSLMAY